STKYPVLKQAILKNPNVKNVTNTSVDVGNKSGKVIFNVETNDGMDQRGINYARVDHDFIETLGIEMVEGRDFQEDIPGDTLKGVIVNETMVKRFNWDKPIGKKVQLEDRSWMAIDATVIGVMKDYHQTGMYNEIETFMLVYRPINTIVYVKLKAKDIKKTIAEIEQAWNEIYPEKPFEYSFLSENFEKQFRADEKRGSIFTLFTCLAIFIACLGLLGLTSYTVERRTKEIGIRKVVGASEGIIVRLISKEFIYLVIISIAIAFPLSYYFMNSWLQNFVYRTHIGSFVFIIAALITIGITFITISYQAWRAAISNPSNSLRAE
ncbi:MAG: ABC transporter permease, partial [Bacteroidales bacterium]|nr:ABC transporter permease [Bacteroidales bacterium]